MRVILPSPPLLRTAVATLLAARTALVAFLRGFVGIGQETPAQARETDAQQARRKLCDHAGRRGRCC